MKITRRTKLLVVALALCFTTMIGSTFAWFTDSVESNGNIITTGNLEVAMHWADNKVDPNAQDAVWKDASEPENSKIFNYTNWEPGYVEVRHVKIANTGDLALKYDLKLEPTDTVSKLADVIDVYYFDPAVQLTSRTQLTADKKIGTLADFIKTNDTSANTAAGVLKAGENHTVTIALMMQTTAGNDYQNLSIGTDFQLVLNATQAAVESDSFGSDYDAGAQNPHKVWYVKNFAELKAAFAQGGTITIVMMEDIALAEEIVMQAGTSVDLDMNGKTLTATGADVDPFIQMDADSSLTIRGNGVVDLEEYYATNFIVPFGHLTIENGSFIKRHKPDVVANKVYGPLFQGTSAGGTIIINGGYFDGGYYKQGDCYNNCIRNLNKSSGQDVHVYGGTFVAQNPAWGDEGGATYCPYCEKNGTQGQGVFLDGQTTTSTELPAGYEIEEGVTTDGTNRPTYTVQYTKP